MKTYNAEFKDQVVKEVQEVGNISLVCRKHGLQTSTVHGWLNRDKNQDKIADKKQIKQLQKQLRDHQMEIEVLKALLKKTYPLWNNEKPLS